MYSIQSQYLKDSADLGEYWFCFLVMNLCFLLSYYVAFHHKKSHFLKILILVFCIFAFWDHDFWGLAHSFFGILDDEEDFKEIIYEYIRTASFGSYSLFRLYIWGGATFFVLKTIRLYGLPQNLFLYIFLVFYLLTFSYPRASLAISMYFYGFSKLLYANKRNYRQIFVGVLFITASFFFHRSMLVTIMLTPFAYFRFNKKRLFVLLIAAPFIAEFFLSFMIGIIGNVPMSNGMFEQFVISSNSYVVVMGESEEYNWKFTLIRYFRFSSFYILMLYIAYIMYSKKNVFLKQESRLFSMVVVIAIFSTLFLGSDMLGLNIIGYRYLFMTGIPLCILTTLAVMRKQCGWNQLQLLLLPAFFYAEGFIFGKILSLYGN